VEGNMRITKVAEERRNEILDVAEKMFLEKGFENTSTIDIAIAINIAKGTLYYHFKTKNEIMNAIIERRVAQVIKELNGITEKESIYFLDRIVMVFKMIKFSDINNEQNLKYLHSNENNIMHQKMQKAMIETFIPILTKLLEEGEKEGIINCPYLHQSIEMLLVYGNLIFDNDRLSKMSNKEIMESINAFIFHIEVLLGTPRGTFSVLKEIFS
jgi:AcrR family transcriptional regulator